MADVSQLRAAIQAAVTRLDESVAHVMRAKSEVTDAGVHLNTVRAAEQNAVGSFLGAISELREGLVSAQQALTGSSDDAAHGSLVWLNQAVSELENDVSRLQQLAEAQVETIRQIGSITTNSEEAILRVRGAISDLTAYANTKI